MIDLDTLVLILNQRLLPAMAWATLTASAGFLIAALIVRVTSLPARLQVWVWRLAFIKAILVLVPATVLPGPIFPSIGIPIPAGASTESRAIAPAAPDTRPDRAASSTLSDGSPAIPAPSPSPIGLLWLTGILAMGAATTRRILAWRGVLSRSLPLDDPEVEDLLESLVRTFGMKRSPRLRVSDEIAGPVCVGTLSPTILVPSRSRRLADRENLKAALAHEIAHVQRRDPFWMLLPAAARAVHLANPLVWYASRRLVQVQECACDDLAVRTARLDRRHYAHRLIDWVDARMPATPTPTYALSASPAYQDLKERIQHLHQGPVLSRRGFLTRASGLAAVGVAVLFPVSVSFTRTVDAPQNGRGPSKTFEAQEWTYGVRFQPSLEGEEYLLSSARGGYRVWDIARHRLHEEVREGEATTVAMDRRGSLDSGPVVTAGLRLGPGRGYRNGSIRIWHPDRKEPETFEAEWRGGVHSLAFSPDQTSLAYQTPDDHMRLITFESRSEIFRRPTFGVTHVDFSKDGRFLAHRTSFNEVEVVDVATGRPVALLVAASGDEIMDVAMSPDGSRVAVAATRKEWGKWVGDVKIFDVGTGDRHHVIPGYLGARSVAWSPDGRFVAGGFHQEIALIDPRTGGRVETLRGHTQDVWGLDFSDRSDRLASASADRRVMVWDL